MKVKDLIRELEEEGWRLDRIKGSHHIFRHDRASRPVVVPIHKSDIPEVWAKEIRKQAAKALRGE